MPHVLTRTWYWYRVRARGQSYGITADAAVFYVRYTVASGATAAAAAAAAAGGGAAAAAVGGATVDTLP